MRLFFEQDFQFADGAVEAAGNSLADDLHGGVVFLRVTQRGAGFSMFGAQRFEIGMETVTLLLNGGQRFG